MNDRLTGTTWDNPIWYRGFRIYINDQWFSAHDAYAYVHDDFDGAPDANDNRYGACATVEDCKAEIDDRFFDEEPEFIVHRSFTGCGWVGLALAVFWIAVAALIVHALWRSPSAWEGGYKTCINEAGNAWVDCPKGR